MSAVSILLWVGETMLAISILIGIILLIRKPVANIFGAGAAYALWLAPFVRLFLPELRILTAPQTTLGVDYVVASPIEAAALTPTLDMVGLTAATLILLWAMVAIAWTYLKLEAQSRYLHAARTSSSMAPSSIQNLTRQQKDKFGIHREIEIRINNTNKGPSVLGLLRPVIFLPANFETEYSKPERELALAHEISHVKRGDIVATLVALLFQAVQWPNPLVHYAMRAFRIDQEAACDAFVLKKSAASADAPGDYASAILKSARHTEPALAYGLSLGHPVKERLMLLKNQKGGIARKLVGGVAVIALTTAGLAGTASYGYAAEKSKKQIEVIEDRDVVLLSDEDGKQMERRVFVIGDGDPTDINIEVSDHDNVWVSSDGTKRRVKTIVRNGEEGDSYFVGDCSTSDGEGEPVKLEWKDESDDNEAEKSFSHTIICLTGDEASADPKERAKHLRKAIDRMEESAKKEEARRKEMIEGLRKQLRELEKKN